jgi:uncharacterized protein YbbK (DUF523 family)
VPPTDRPRVGISACLLGEKVRYNGGDKRDPVLLDALGQHVDWIAVCPEVEVGMGTPREPVQLVRVAGGLRVVTSETGVDYTDTMADWAERRLDDLARQGIAGYILKKSSPSCGTDAVMVFSDDAEPSPSGRGVFADALIRRFPGLPVEEEDRLHDPRALRDFVDRVRAYQRGTSSPCATRDSWQG